MTDGHGSTRPVIASPRRLRSGRRARRHIGIGIASGLGMAPFLARHPVLLNNWIAGRETALARVRSVEEPTLRHVARLKELLVRAQVHVAEWVVDDPDQMARITRLAGDITRLLERCEK